MCNDIAIRRVLILLAIVSYGAYFAFNQISPDGRTLPPNYKYKDLFPNTRYQVSRETPSPIKPTRDTFAIWRFIYSYQWLITLYMFITLFRKDSLQILPVWFYIFWILACFAGVAYTIIRLRGDYMGGFFMTALGAVFRHGALGFSFYGLHARTKIKPPVKCFDLWCNRLVVQNGLLFRQAWSSVASVVGLATTLTYKFSVDSNIAAYSGLSILAIITFGWFILQNFVIEKDTRFTGAEYVCLIVASTGILRRAKEEMGLDHTYSKVCLALVCLNAILLLVRIILIIRNERRVAKKPKSVEKVTEMQTNF